MHLKLARGQLSLAHTRVETDMQEQNREKTFMKSYCQNLSFLALKLYSPDKVHTVANNENENNIKLADLTKNNTVIHVHTARCDNKQYTMHRRP